MRSQKKDHDCNVTDHHHISGFWLLTPVFSFLLQHKVISNHARHFDRLIAYLRC